MTFFQQITTWFAIANLITVRACIGSNKVVRKSEKRLLNVAHSDCKQLIKVAHSNHTLCCRGIIQLQGSYIYRWLSENNGNWCNISCIVSKAVVQSPTARYQEFLISKSWSDSALWQTPLYQQKIRKPKDNTKTPPKLRIHNDCGPTKDGQFYWCG